MLQRQKITIYYKFNKSDSEIQKMFLYGGVVW